MQGWFCYCTTDMMSIVYLNLNASCDLLENKQPVTVLPSRNSRAQYHNTNIHMENTHWLLVQNDNKK